MALFCRYGRNLRLLVVLTAAAAGMEEALAQVDVERRPLRIGSFIDAGQIWKGELDFGEKVEKQVVTRTKVALTQSTLVGERLLLTGAVGGLFFYSLPVTEAPHTRITKFTAAVEEASGHYKFGDVDEPWLDFKFGLFFHKYNPDAKNLGEYQFRSGTYPGYLWTGGWYIINNAGYFGQGIRADFHLLDNSLDLSALLFMERDWEPTYDLSPSLQFAWHAGDVLTLGGGVTYSHLIPARPSITSPENRASAYYIDPATGQAKILNAQDATFGAATSPITNDMLTFYTFQGIKLMGRASFNPQAVLQSEVLGPEDLKLYAELAVLGVKDYPVFYEKITERIPLMVGINLPAFNLLDVLSLELEYYNSPFHNSLYEVYENTLPIPGTTPGDLNARLNYVDSLALDPYKKDTMEKLKWSVYAKKELVQGMGLVIQVASDHFRPIDFNIKPTYRPVTQRAGHWYYMARLEFGI